MDRMRRWMEVTGGADNDDDGFSPSLMLKSPASFPARTGGESQSVRLACIRNPMQGQHLLYPSIWLPFLPGLPVLLFSISVPVLLYSQGQPRSKAGRATSTAGWQRPLRSTSHRCASRLHPPHRHRRRRRSQTGMQVCTGCMCLCCRLLAPTAAGLLSRARRAAAPWWWGRGVSAPCQVEAGLMPLRAPSRGGPHMLASTDLAAPRAGISP